MNNINKNSQKDRPTYKDTLNLLQTNFGMRANATLREPELQAFWREKNIDFELGLNNSGGLLLCMMARHMQMERFIWGMLSTKY